ncbi:alpha/beta hydrolase [Williamsia soli]|uniref:alpha/beta hydrolase n=1 Tax=Williamsia soli TaxID=364929 RepID=UPI001A9EF0F9|nr:alpha/beta hydrolase family protein [Williamsia soli]
MRAKFAWRKLVAGAAAVVAGVTLSVAAVPATASAEPQTVRVYSASMGKSIPVKVLPAAGGGSNNATLYLLDGLRAPNNNSGWLLETDVQNFFAGKNVNVAIPFGGGGSFYTDWQRDDPTLGRQKWETFLTRELPAYMQANFGSDNRRNAIAGLSMSGTSALNLASKHPNFYQGVASYSGYPTVSSPGFAQGIAASVLEMGGNPVNMWGIWPAGAWLENDPSLHTANLRGKRVYVSSGAGSPSTNPAFNPASASFDPIKFSQMVPLEAAAGISSQLYVASLQAAGINPQTHITPEGVHWWSFWQDRLKESWYGTLAPALGV